MSSGFGSFGQKPAGTGTTGGTAFGSGFGTSGSSTTGGAFGQNKTGFGTGTTTTGFGANKGFGTGGFGTGGFGTGGFGLSKEQYMAVLKPDRVFDRMWKLRCAYNPKSPGYRFCYVFYNKKQEGTKFPQPPENISQDDWVKICTSMPDPDNLVPCPLYGFEALERRVESQKTMGEKLKERMDLVQSHLQRMKSFYETRFRGSLEQIQQNQITIQQQLMEVAEIEEAQQHQGQRLTKDEEDMLRKLEQLNLEISKPECYDSAIRELELRAQQSVKPVTGVKMTVNKQTLEVFAGALKTNQEALEALERVVKGLKKQVTELRSNPQ